MNWEAIGAIGEIVGAIAVLASLIFVGLQIRQSAAQTQKSNVLARADMSERSMRSFGDTVSELMRSAELAEAFRKVMFDSMELTALERTLVLTFFNVYMLRHHAAFISASDDLLDARVLPAFDSNTTWYLANPIFAKEWRRVQKQGQAYTEGFQEHVAAILTDTS